MLSGEFIRVHEAPTIKGFFQGKTLCLLSMGPFLFYVSKQSVSVCYLYLHM